METNIEKQVIVNNYTRYETREGENRVMGFGHSVCWTENGRTNSKDYISIKKDKRYGIFSVKGHNRLKFKGSKTSSKEASERTEELALEFAKDLSSRLGKTVLNKTSK